MARISDRLARTRQRIAGQWPLDLKWLEAFRAALETVDVVSFDVFDTALTRCVESPVDVFALMEQMLVARHGASMSELAVAREQAERIARRRAHENGLFEVTYAEILTELAVIRPEDRARLAEISEVELAAEREVLLAVPEILQAVTLALEAGKDVVFVSDMYLPHAAIQSFLADAGYPDQCGLLVSSETGQTKADGGQWDVLRETVGDKRAILHIGDNPWSDGEAARAQGIEVLLYEGAQSPARRGGALTPDILPVSLQSRLVRLREGHAPVAPGAVMSALGESWGSVVLGSYVGWLAERASAIGVRHIYFCARDGWLPLQAWHAGDYGAKTGITVSYLHVSRRSLSFAAAAAVSTPDRLGVDAIETLVRRHGPHSVKDLLTRNGVPHEDAVLADATACFGSLDHILEREDDDTLRALFQRHARIFYAVLNEDFSRASAYLIQEGVDQGAVALVDVGWNGTLQNAIANILRKSGRQPALYGFYCGLWNDAQRHRPGAGWMEAAFGSDFIHDPEQYAIRNAVDILENLFASADGTTSGYASEDGRMVARLAESGPAAAQYEQIIRPFQEGALAVLRQLHRTGEAGALDADMLTVEAGAAAIARLSLAPTSAEIATIGAISHASDMAHTRHVPMVPECSMADPMQAGTDFPYRSWPVASALTMLDRLKGEARARVVQAAQIHFSHFDARTKEQFL